jgi:hypothetical protein
MEISDMESELIDVQVELENWKKKCKEVGFEDQKAEWPNESDGEE